MDQQTIADYPVGGAATTPTFRYVYASYIDEPVVRKTAGTGETLVYFHRNQQYSITAVTTSAGTISERYAYTAYGQPTTLDASGTVLQTSNFSLRYSFTGREWDATLGLHHFRARWMSPSAGRFLGRDPIGYEGSEWGLYEYCRNSPLIYLDPGGEILWAIPVAWPAIPAVNAAVAAAVAAAGYTLVECMSNPVCVMAVPAAIAQALANLTGAARIALVAGCQAVHGAYKVAEAACKLNRECIEQPAGHCLLKLVRCYDATRNLACWTGVWKLRLAYIASGCDFAIPTRANHPKAVVFANNKAIECANSILNNCFGEVAY
jgi:RHS repeat-associated protein